MFNPKTIVTDVASLSGSKQLYLAALTAIAVFMSVAMGDPWYGTLCAGAGALCVVLVAEGKLSNFFWGFLNCAAYGYISYTNNIMGDMALNWFVYVPFQFLGLYLWSKNQNAGNDVVVARRMDFADIAALSGFALLAVMLFSSLLDAVGSSKTMVDSANVVLSLIATALMAYRFREQWICWIIVNITGIVLWSLIAIDPKGHAAASGLVMWVVFFINSCYGYYNWNKLSKDNVLQ